MNNYYDINLKIARLKQIEGRKNFQFIKLDIANREGIERLFFENKFDIVVNLAAQAGVRYSLINPYAYIDSNIVGFMNILEGCRHTKVKYLVFALSRYVLRRNTYAKMQIYFTNIDKIKFGVVY